MSYVLQCWISVLFYGYALAKDYSDGSYYRDNDYVKAAYSEDLAGLLEEHNESSESRPVNSDTLLPTHAQNNTTPLPPNVNSTANKIHSSRYNNIAKRQTQGGKTM